MKALFPFLCAVLLAWTAACTPSPEAVDTIEAPRPSSVATTVSTQPETQTPTQNSEPTPRADTSPAATESENQTEEAGTPNPAPPDHPVMLVFVHHSTGENWLSDENGGLGLALRDQNYFASDTNYDWGPYAPELDGPIGSYTDIGHWWTWFLSPLRQEITAALFRETGQHSTYSRLERDPWGENQIIVFKSCFPNSGLAGNPDDAPTQGENPLRGEGAGSEFMTVANAKGIYVDLLSYFATRRDKLFVVISAPPLHKRNTSPEAAANARAFNRWLVEDWLRDYPLKNVAVFDFYNVLTSNGGNIDTNDLDAEGGNHHRWRNGQVEYITTQGGDTSAYARADDDHPTAAGGQKATAEFLPLLNIAYHRWIGE